MAKLWWATLFATILIAGCGLLPNRVRPEKISAVDLSSGAGIIILSAGAPSPCTSTPTELDIKQAGVPYTGPTVAYMPADTSIVKSDFSDHHGFLHVIKLDPGMYYLTTGLMRPYFKGLKVPKYNFLINAGDVLYLGEYYMTSSCSMSTVAQLRDQEQRDITLLKQRNPVFADVRIRKQIPPMSGYAIGGDE